MVDLQEAHCSGSIACKKNEEIGVQILYGVWS